MGCDSGFVLSWFKDGIYRYKMGEVPTGLLGASTNSQYNSRATRFSQVFQHAGCAVLVTQRLLFRNFYPDVGIGRSGDCLPVVY